MFSQFYHFCCPVCPCVFCCCCCCSSFWLKRRESGLVLRHHASKREHLFWYTSLTMLCKRGYPTEFPFDLIRLLFFYVYLSLFKTFFKWIFILKFQKDILVKSSDCDLYLFQEQFHSVKKQWWYDVRYPVAMKNYRFKSCILNIRSPTLS